MFLNHDQEENDPTYTLDSMFPESSLSSENFNELLATSEIHITEASISTISYYKRKLNEAVDNFKRIYFEKVASGQRGQFLDNMEDLKQPLVIPDDLILLHEAYQNTQMFSQKVLILSAIPPLLNYLKEYLMKTFKCNK